MIAQWDSSLSSLWPGFSSQPRRSILRDFPWLIALCQPVLSQRGKKWLSLPSTTPHNLCTAAGRSPTTVRRWLIKNNEFAWLTYRFDSGNKKFLSESYRFLLRKILLIQKFCEECVTVAS